MRSRVIGREKESRLVLVALAAGRDLLLEGPPGTSKSTLLRAITDAAAQELHFVEGNSDLTPGKLLGHHSPSRVLEVGYGADSFLEGPLPQAMREGGFLYLEELNRVPEDTLNVLITAMAERQVAIPRVGVVAADPRFRVIAAMNPFDNIGTGRLSSALTDRFCRVRLSYQSELEERGIVSAQAALKFPSHPIDSLIVDVAVRAVRLTREHAELRVGASVRAAIDFALVADRLIALEQPTALLPSLIEAATTALGIKIVVRDGSKHTDDEIVAEVVTRALEQILAERGGPPSSTSNEGDRSGGPSGGHDGTLSHAGGQTPPHSVTFGGSEITREAAQSRALQPAERRAHAVAKERPELSALLDDHTPELSSLEEALAERDDQLEVLGDLAAIGDRAQIRALARRYAVQLIVREARRTLGRRRGRGLLTRRRYRGDAAELDLERTLEAKRMDELHSDEDYFVLERPERTRSHALLLDVSGSMKGEKVFHASLAVAAVAMKLEHMPLAVIAFWRDATCIKHLREPRPIDAMVDEVLSLSGRGLTDISLALRMGLDELAHAPTEERVGILFSDGLATSGVAPDALAAAYSTLHVIGTGDDEESFERCRELARLGRGRAAFVEHASDIPRALSACLS